MCLQQIARASESTLHDRPRTCRHSQGAGKSAPTPPGSSRRLGRGSRQGESDGERRRFETIAGCLGHLHVGGGRRFPVVPNTPWVCSRSKKPMSRGFASSVWSSSYCRSTTRSWSVSRVEPCIRPQSLAAGSPQRPLQSLPSQRARGSWRSSPRSMLPGPHGRMPPRDPHRTDPPAESAG